MTTTVQSTSMLGPTQDKILRLMQDGRIRTSPEVAAIEGISKGSAARALYRMATPPPNGLVRRAGSSGSAFRWQITESGLEAARALPAEA